MGTADDTSSTGASGTGASAAGGRLRVTDWWYLGFLTMLLFQPTFDPDSGTFAWVVTAATAAVFAPLYVVAVSRPGGRTARLAPYASVALGMVVFPINSGATVLLVYAAGFVGGTRPRRVAYRWFAVLSALAAALGILVPLPMPIALAAFGVPIVFVWVVGVATLEEVERDREAARLRVDNQRIAHLSTATERERIARDLHDVTGQSLTSIVVRAQLVARLAASDPERAANEARRIEEAARGALDDIRETISGWRQVSLDDELDSAEGALAAAGIELTVERERDLRLAPSVEQALGLAVREAITNVIRHADAQRCRVCLHHVDGQLELEVTDDGNGAGGPDGGGLAGMADRIGALGGRVERSWANGTRLVVALPAEVAG